MDRGRAELSSNRYFMTFMNLSIPLSFTPTFPVTHITKLPISMSLVAIPVACLFNKRRAYHPELGMETSFIMVLHAFKEHVS